MKNPFKNKKREKNKREAMTGTSVRIVVHRKLGKSLDAETASFVAEMTKDRDFNIYLEDQQYEFKESISFVQHEIIQNLKYKLDLLSMSKDEREEEVKKKINEQENRIKRIKGGYLYETEEDLKKQTENCERVNIHDERALLKNYKVLLDNIKYADDNGSYEGINLNGERVIHFNYIDGVLYPLMWPVQKETIYVDTATKRKLNREAQDDINAEYIEETSNPFQNLFGKIMWVLVVVLIIGNAVWSAELARRSNEIAGMLNDGTIGNIVDKSAGSIAYCATVYKDLIKDNKKLLNYAHAQIMNKSNPPDEQPEKDEIEDVIDLNEQITGDE